MKNTMKKILCTVLVAVICIASMPFGVFNFTAVAVEYKVDDIMVDTDNPNIDVKITPLNTLTFTVIDEATEQPIANVTVNVTEQGESFDNVIKSVTTDENGQTTLTLPEGDYVLSLSQYNYQSIIVPVTINEESTNGSIYLTPIKKEAVSGDCGADGDNVKWVLYNDGELVISGNGAMADYAGTDRPPWNYIRGNIRKATIESGVTRIGEKAFYDCYHIRNIAIPNTIKSIGCSAFLCCSLDNIVIPNSVTTIEDGAFSGYKGNGELIIPDSVTYIGESAFSYCSYLTNITLPKNITTIKPNTFYSCTQLQNITIPDSVTLIEDNAFTLCESLENVVLPENITSINKGAFQGCESLESVAIPDSVITINEDAFSYCDVLANVTIGNSVTTIGENAFFECYSLDDVYYKGTEEEWKKVEIYVGNEYLTNATIHYESIESDNIEFPSGYNFEEDSYSFRNYGEKISKKYFTTMYEEGPGEQLYKKKKNNSTNGLCFGFAYTTAAIYNGLPSITSIYEKNILSDNKYRNQICEIKKNDKFNIGNLEISIEDYIKYAFIYQWSQESLYDNIDMGAYITKMIQNNFLSVVIGIEDKITGEGHAFLVVGCKVIGGGDTIYYIDDSNDKDNELETLTITQNGDWYYSRPWNSTPRNNNTSRIQIFYDTHQPYNFLQTGKKATVKDCINLNGLSTTETYIENMDRVNADKVLLYVDSDSNEINCDDMVEIADYTSSGTDSNTEDVGKFYWINNDKTVTITDLAKDSNEISLAGDNTILTANVTKDSTVTMTIDDSDINTKIETEKGDEYTVSVETIIEDEEYNNVSTVTEISGTASGSEITATQTDSGLLVTGISDGTVTLTKDDEVIETQEIKDAVGEIEITYDKTGEDEDVELDYHSHSYSSSITTPATHTSEGVETFTCDCGDSYTKPVAKLEGHTHTVTNTVAPTCTKNGLTVYTCACGDSYSETVKAKGHSYGDDGICVNCDDYNKAYDKTANDSENCSHLCHKGGFMGFIWKIVQIFIRLFKTNPVCECGAAHY